MFYLDPPYISDTRISPKVYDKEMPIEKHSEMIDALIKIKGKCILSGYNHELYDILIDNKWKKINIGEYLITAIALVIIWLCAKYFIKR